MAGQAPALGAGALDERAFGRQPLRLLAHGAGPGFSFGPLAGLGAALARAVAEAGAGGQRSWRGQKCALPARTPAATAPGPNGRDTVRRAVPFQRTACARNTAMELKVAADNAVRVLLRNCLFTRRARHIWQKHQ